MKKNKKNFFVLLRNKNYPMAKMTEGVDYDFTVNRVNVTADRPAYYRAYMKRHPAKRRMYQERYLQKRYGPSAQQIRDIMDRIDDTGGTRTAYEVDVLCDYNDRLTAGIREQLQCAEKERSDRVKAENKITTLADTKAELAAFWATCKSNVDEVQLV
jgi:hypothetical protein